jgi:PhzF family phenazine biosynthesis protein
MVQTASRGKEEAMGQMIVQVDSFTARPFAGNPAAVCVLSEPRSPGWMQAVAREMNLSETAFLVPYDDGFELRWFTPAVEVDLCGHATLASAHVLWEEGRLGAGAEARFSTRSGLLTARRNEAWIEMDFPATVPRPTEPPAGLLDALGVTPVSTGLSRFDALIEVADEREVRAAAPDFGALRRIEIRGVILTAPAATSDFDFVSRFFAPAVGVDEDPVTGSAHCALAPYWAAKLGKDELIGFQASARGGVVRVRARGERVTIAGQAVTVLRGELSDLAETAG